MSNVNTAGLKNGYPYREIVMAIVDSFIIIIKFSLCKAIFLKKTCSAASTHTFGFESFFQSVLKI